MDTPYRFLIYSFYIPYIYLLNMFHIFSIVCFLIHGVNRRQVLIAKPCLYLLPDFTPFIFLLAISWFFIRINDFSNKIIFLGPYGPQPGPSPNPRQKSEIGHVRTCQDLSRRIHKGPYWAHKGHKGPILLKKSLILFKKYKSINKNIKIVNLEILKVKTWFGDKDLFS